MSRSSLVSAVRLEGALFSRDFLARLGSPGVDPSFLHLADYRFETPRELREAISASWNVLSARWQRFRDEYAKAPAGDAATGLTRQVWLLPLLEELRFGRVQPAAPIRVVQNGETKEYPISHGWNRTPLHLLGAGVELDKRTARVSGAAQAAPHALLQECLNRSGEHLWGIVSNGLRWRVLRDSAAIARLSYLEFDLEAIFDSDNTADFALFWMLCHASRFEWREQHIKPTEESAPAGVEATPPILEEWMQKAHEEGAQVRDKMRDGVQEAIGLLATGLLRHPDNTALRAWLREKDERKQEFYRLSLRVIYRILFLLVAEAKDALLLPQLAGAGDAAQARHAARERYERFYGMAQLRARATRSRGTAHGDAWHGLRQTFRFFRADEPELQDGLPELAIPALGGFLFDRTLLDDCELANQDLFAALRALCFFQDGAARRAVNFNLGSEELGSIYESLLELSPELDLDARTFALRVVAGNEQKTTGSYYTPEGLVKSLLDSALEPLLDRAAKDGEVAILNLTVCDPACGSGHFLTAAARRIADRLARLRSGGDEPNIHEVRRARREVIGRCIFGIDLNPMAVELCKVALWMEAIEPGKPLNFLDTRIRPGNSLLGATPQLIAGGLPDEAFAPLEGDDRAVCAELKKRNRQEKAGQQTLGFGDRLPLGDLRAIYAPLDAPETDLAQVRAKEKLFAQIQSGALYEHTHLLADAWCAAFVWRKIRDSEPDFIEPITDDDLAYIRAHALTMMPNQKAEIQRLAARYHWFHPHLEFPHVFGTNGNGGFDLIIGNPPWERVKLQEKEWFAARVPEIALAPNAAARGRLIKALQSEQPEMHAAFLEARRGAEGESHFARKSGRFPLCGRGDVNTYALFAELNRQFISDLGRVGCILPSGIATDDTTKEFFADCVNSRALVSLFDFENRQALFPGIHRSFKFCLLTLSGEDDAARRTQFVFFALRPDHTDDPARRFELSPDEIALLNPNTHTCPIFRSSRDAELTKAIYRRVPILWREGDKDGNPWGISFSRMLDMSNDSYLFRIGEQLEAEGFARAGNEYGSDYERYLPLYEAKMLHQFDHRWASYDGLETRDVTPEQKANPDFVVQPRYWVRDEVVESALPRVPKELWDVLAAGNERDAAMIVSNWYLGYLMNHGQEAEAERLEATLPLGNFALDTALVWGTPRAWAANWENTYPLRFEEVQLIEQRGDWLDLATVLRDNRTPKWLLAFRDIARNNDERTVIASMLPCVGVGHTAPLIFTKHILPFAACLMANLNSFAFDYVARQKVGGTHLTYNLFKQLSVLPPETYGQTARWTGERTLCVWMRERVLELVYTARDMEPLARKLGYEGEPFAWDEARRFALRCELDAAFFHLYGLSRDEAAYMLDTFPIVRRHEERDFGTYRTKDAILKVYDDMA